MGRSKDPILSVRLPDDLESRLNKCAEKLDLSKNDIARHAIRAGIEAIEKNGYKIQLPLEMAVAGTVESRVPFASTVVLPSPVNEAASRLNEEEPQVAPRDAAVLQPQTKITRTRAKLRNLAKKEPLET